MSEKGITASPGEICYTLYWGKRGGGAWRKRMGGRKKGLGKSGGGLAKAGRMRTETAAASLFASSAGGKCARGKDTAAHKGSAHCGATTGRGLARGRTGGRPVGLLVLWPCKGGARPGMTLQGAA